ncbi:hypothetical protein BJY52DRAFT_1419039 [Lactarius psammicola]|nr:hypothetical protein BJY52DRAFT_1419039 [Lactarius psammicola]
MLHLDDLWRRHPSAEATPESQSSALRVIPVVISLDGGDGSGGICMGYWELVKGESELSILHKLVVQSLQLSATSMSLQIGSMHRCGLLHCKPGSAAKVLFRVRVGGGPLLPTWWWSWRCGRWSWHPGWCSGRR